jgi:hypothetical protein
VNLQVKLVTWEHLNFDVLMRSSTRLFSIVDKVRDRHGGSIGDVVLYRHQVHPQNILLDMGKTLDEVGFEGGTQNDPKDEVVWYDYQAHSSQCPLLLSSPRGASRKDVAKKVRKACPADRPIKVHPERKDNPLNATL